MSLNSRNYSKTAQQCHERIEQKVLTAPASIYEDCQKLLQYAAEENSDALMGLGYYHFAEYYFSKPDADQVMYCLMEAVKYFPKAEMYDYLARCYNIMGVVADSQDNRVLALEYFHICIQYCEKYGITYVLAMAEANMSSILHNMGEDERAVALLKSAAAHYHEGEKMPRTEWNLMLTVIGLGYCYLELGKYKEAEHAEQQVQEMIQGKEETEIPVLALNILKAEMAHYRGSNEEAAEYVRQVIENIRMGAVYMEYSDYLIDVAHLLSAMKEHTLLLEMLLSIQSWVKQDAGLELQTKWYYYMLECYEHLGMEEEYIALAKKYFELHEVYARHSRETARKAIELRNKLNVLQQRQYNMMALNAELKMISQHDPMTGLANRTYLNEYLEKQFEQAWKENKKLAVELMDIDCFKKYNDFYGHLAGDKCIEKIAMLLKSIENDKIFCARYGGDEFMLVYTDMEKEQVCRTAETIRKKVMDMCILHENSDIAPVVTVTQGIVCKVPEETGRVWDYCVRADKCLYEAKKSGKNRVRCESD